jgi:DNA-binding beta-propeller fold protein YncE
VVSEASPVDSISVLSWADGKLLTRLGHRGSRPGQLIAPRGVRLSADGERVVAADCWNHRVSVFKLSGEVVTTVGSNAKGLKWPHDVLEYTEDNSFLVTSFPEHRLVKLSATGDVTWTLDEFDTTDGESSSTGPTALAMLPSGGLVVREEGHIRVFHTI